mmetsp:Transcript_37506/g.88260  ORF Transcript_37506/g.88260 Transcript_37506/m.88260 type:complete len:483 (-) Transcript_37506:923-2371(-)
MRSTLSRKDGTASTMRLRITADSTPRTPPPSRERILNSGRLQSGSVHGFSGGPGLAYLMKGMTAGGGFPAWVSFVASFSASSSTHTSSRSWSSGNHSIFLIQLFPPLSRSSSWSPASLRFWSDSSTPPAISETTVCGSSLVQMRGLEADSIHAAVMLFPAASRNSTTSTLFTPNAGSPRMSLSESRSSNLPTATALSCFSSGSTFKHAATLSVTSFPSRLSLSVFHSASQKLKSGWPSLAASRACASSSIFVVSLYRFMMSRGFPYHARTTLATPVSVRVRAIRRLSRPSWSASRAASSGILAWRMMSLSNASSSFASQLSRFARSNSPRLALPSRPLAFACSSLAFWSRFGPVASARLFLASFSALFSLPAFASLGALEADAGKRMPASAEFRIESTFFRFFPSPKAASSMRMMVSVPSRVRVTVGFLLVVPLPALPIPLRKPAISCSKLERRMAASARSMRALSICDRSTCICSGSSCEV